MKLLIRSASAVDASAISTLVSALSQYVLDDSTNNDLAPFLTSLTTAAYLERIESPRFVHYVAEDLNGICGVIALRDNSHLFHLFVRSDAHRKGIARALWEHAKALSLSNTFTVNSALFAVPVYARFGFIENGDQQTANGVTFVPMVFTERPIAL